MDPHHTKPCLITTHTTTAEPNLTTTHPMGHLDHTNPWVTFTQTTTTVLNLTTTYNIIMRTSAAAPIDPLDHTKPCLTTTHTTTAELNPITTPDIPHPIAHTAHLLTAPMDPTMPEVR